MRKLLLAALAVALLIALAAPTESTARFYGVYDSFTYASTPKKRLFKTDHERFSAMRSAGLNTVLNYATFRMSIKENLRYAWAAQQHGIRVLWALHYYGSHGPGLKWKLRLVNRTKALPATLGYYVGDEVMFGTDEARRMEELTTRIESRTKKKTLYTAKPNPAEVTPFAGWTDWLAVDPYPVGYPAGTGGTAAEEVGAAMSWAGGAVRPSALAVALQLFSWSYYRGVEEHGVKARWPTPKEVDSMRRAAEGASPKVVLWFSFYNVTDRRRAQRSLAYWNSVAPHLAPLDRPRSHARRRVGDRLLAALDRADGRLSHRLGRRVGFGPSASSSAQMSSSSSSSGSSPRRSARSSAIAAVTDPP